MKSWFVTKTFCNPHPSTKSISPFWPRPNLNPCFRSFGNGWFHLGKSFLCWWSHGSTTWIPWWKWTHWKKYHYSIRNRAQTTHANFSKIGPQRDITWCVLWLWKDNINCAEIECNSLKLNFNVCTAGFGCESRFVAAACPCGRDLNLLSVSRRPS